LRIENYTSPCPPSKGEFDSINRFKVGIFQYFGEDMYLNSPFEGGQGDVSCFGVRGMFLVFMKIYR
jgi:hypothetical protein